MTEDQVAKEIFEGWGRALDSETKEGWYDWVAKWHLEKTAKLRQALSNIANLKELGVSERLNSSYPCKIAREALGE